jgi:pseudouridine-5'-phosphate glycosidase
LDEFTAEVLVGVIVGHLGVFVAGRVGLVVFVTTGGGEVHVGAKVAAKERAERVRVIFVVAKQ